MCPCRARPADARLVAETGAPQASATGRTEPLGPLGPCRSGRTGAAAGTNGRPWGRRNRGSPAFQLAQQGRCVRAIRIVVRRSSNVLNSRVNALGSSTVKVAAPAAAIHLGPELAFQLHQAPDLGAVHADVGLDVGSQLADGGQVDAE